MMKPKENPKPAAKKLSVSDQSFDYYKRVYASFKDIPENDRDVFFTNVFRQLKSESLVVCQHKILSYKIEELLKFAQPKHICMLWEAFIPDWMEVCTDVYASHVFHSLLLCFPMTFDLDHNILSIKKEEEGKDDDDDDEKTNATDTEQANKDDSVKCTRKMFLEFCSFLKENLGDLLTNAYATHIVRATLQVLTNIPVANNITIVHSNQKTKSNKSQLHVSKSDETFHKEFFSISKLIIKSPYFITYISLSTVNPVIQLILALTVQLKQSKGEKLCKKIIRLCGFFDVPPIDPDTPLTDYSRLPKLMMDVYATYLIQLLLQHCSEDLFLAWYESSFKDRLIAYAVNEQSNYLLKQVIDRCPNKQMFGLIFNEITPYLEDMLSMKHMGVVKSLLQKCLSLETKQKKIVKKLLRAFHCSEEDKKIMIAPLLIVMKTHEVYMENIEVDDKVENPKKFAKIPVNIQGSMVLQILFKFGNPKFFVDSFLHLTPKQMISVMCQFHGSFIIRDFFKSSTIEDKSKDAFLQKISTSYSEIACDKVGSHSWQNTWPYLNIGQKTIVAEELCKDIEKIKSNKYGFYVHKNLALDTFQHQRQQWQTSQSVLSNKRKIFDDILDPHEVGKKVKEM